MKILVVDDHVLVRSGFTLLISNMAGMQVVGEASDGREAVRLARELQPDIVVMDITMRGLSGLEAIEQVRSSCPKTRVVMLSMHANEEFVAKALRAGAVGYLLKEAAAGELEIALRAIALGQVYLSPVISRQVVDRYLGGASAGSDILTRRQREVLQLIGEGKSTKEMAKLLHLSVKTIEAHRAQLMERLDIHDVAGLIRYAMRIGLIPPEGPGAVTEDGASL